MPEPSPAGDAGRGVAVKRSGLSLDTRVESLSVETKGEVKVVADMFSMQFDRLFTALSVGHEAKEELKAELKGDIHELKVASTAAAIAAQDARLVAMEVASGAASTLGLPAAGRPPRRRQLRRTHGMLGPL